MQPPAGQVDVQGVQQRLDRLGRVRHVEHEHRLPLKQLDAPGDAEVGKCPPHSLGVQLQGVVPPQHVQRAEGCREVVHLVAAQQGRKQIVVTPQGRPHAETPAQRGIRPVRGRGQGRRVS
ncbi:MAG: hypothetical protein AMK73_10255, partial [Planctomycetes bacterium SM23_32]